MDSLCQNISLSTVFCPSDFAKAIATNIGVKFIKINKIDEPIACFIGFLHCTVCSVIIAKWLMNQKQIHIICFQFLQGFLNRSLCFFISCIADLDLCGNERMCTISIPESAIHIMNRKEYLNVRFIQSLPVCNLRRL